MRVLISNDDGYYARGIQKLIIAVSKIAEVLVIAPNKNKSASSSSLSVTKELRPIKIKKNTYILDGTPSDCVHLAMCGFFKKKIDLVISGVNLGANLGDDVIYSGTVAAAIEGRFLGLPSIAISLVGCEGNYFDTATSVSVNLINSIKNSKLSADSILNVNIPDVDITKICGYKSTRLGKRHKSESIVASKKKQGAYKIGNNGAEADNSIGTDFYAIDNNFVSITPLQIDMTKYQEMQNLTTWLECIDK